MSAAQRQGRPVEGRDGPGRARPRVGAAVHLEAVPHGVGHASGIDAALVPPQAEAVAKAVDHGPLGVGLHGFTERDPGCFARQIVLDAVGSAGARAQRRQLDQARLPPGQQVPLLHLTAAK